MTNESGDPMMSVKTHLRRWRARLQSVAAVSRLRFFRAVLRRQTDPGDGAEIIVTMTTYHLRFEQAKLAIESILQQEIDVPFAVHLYLSRADLTVLGGDAIRGLDYLVRRGLRVTVVEENLRSYKKLVYALAEYPGKILVTADDDVCYPRSWLRRLLEKSRQFPGAVVCFRGHRLSLDARGSLIRYGDMMRSDVSPLATRASFSLMPTGVSGVLYPSGSLADMARDEKRFLELAPTADDVWFKVAAMLRGTQAILVSPRNVHFPHVPGSQDDSLFELNVAGGRNDVQLAACFSAYGEALECLRREAESASAVSDS